LLLFLGRAFIVVAASFSALRSRLPTWRYSVQLRFKTLAAKAHFPAGQLPRFLLGNINISKRI
jgi:hypothetical protein